MARRAQPGRKDSRESTPAPGTRPARGGHPGGGLLSTGELALALGGLHKQAVHKMRDRGCPPAKRVGKACYWRLEDVLAWRARNLHEPPRGPNKGKAKRAAGRAPGMTPGSAPSSIAPVPPGTYDEDDPPDEEDQPAARAGGKGKPDTVIEADLRLKWAREQLALLELQKRSGDLVPAQEVREAWSRRVMNAKRLLESLPPAVAQDICAACGLGTALAPKIERAVGDAFAQVMQRLSSARDSAP